MQEDGYAFMVDCATKFFDTVYVSGWFSHATDRLRSVDLAGVERISQTSRIGVEHGGVAAALGPDKGFCVQVLLQGGYSDGLQVEFVTEAGWHRTVPLADLVAERLLADPAGAVSAAFYAEVNAHPSASLLDIGGRDRSANDWGRLVPLADRTVLDIVPGDNVDVLGDAHELSRLLPAESFDYVMAISVFEHLLMPWKVALEMNAVMKTGAKALVSTHQTIGMHDIPWDFWRFSDTAWDALFNRRTGFRIVDRAMGHPQFILPFYTRADHLDAERAAGYESSLVVVERCGLADMAWDVRLDEITDTAYPTAAEEGPTPS